MSAPEGFVDRMAGEFVAEGFPRIPARVLMALTGSPEGRLTSPELAGEAGVSPAAISGAVRYLELLGMVRRTTVQGSRLHAFALDDAHPWYTGSLSRDVVYERIIRAVRVELEVLPPGPVRDRMLDMESFYSYLRRRLPELLTEWRAEQAQPRAAATSRSKAASRSASTD